MPVVPALVSALALTMPSPAVLPPGLAIVAPTAADTADPHCRPVARFDWDWTYPTPTCDGILIGFPDDLPDSQLGIIELNVHTTAGAWQYKLEGQDYRDMFPDGHAGASLFIPWCAFTGAEGLPEDDWAVTWVQVHGTNYHWQGSVVCGEEAGRPVEPGPEIPGPEEEIEVGPEAPGPELPEPELPEPEVPGPEGEVSPGPVDPVPEGSTDPQDPVGPDAPVDPEAPDCGTGSPTDGTDHQPSPDLPWQAGVLSAGAGTLATTGTRTAVGLPLAMLTGGLILRHLARGRSRA